MNRGKHIQERMNKDPVRALADQEFSRAAGAPLIQGNSIRLLIDATENYPAWLEAIAAARHHIHFESYIIHEDSAGHQIADALIAKAQQGLRVRLIYDWMGGLGKASRKFWNRMRAAGIADCNFCQWKRIERFCNRVC
jgi:cardiolipin synthase